MYSVHKFALIKGLLLAAAILVATPASADTEGWGTIQITSNDYYDWYPRISEHTVVWQGQVDQQDWEILYYNIDTTSIHQLTNNTYDDYDPVICYPYVVWESVCGTGDTYEIWFCDLSAVKPKPLRLTNNDYHDIYPDVSIASRIDPHPNVVWQGNPTGDNWEIFCYDGTSTEQLTDDVKDDQLPKVSREKIVWRNGTESNEWEIYLYTGTVPIRLTDNLSPDSRPHISGSAVAWECFDAGYWEIYGYYAGSVKRITNNVDVNDRHPVVSGTRVAWQRGDYPSARIGYYDFTTPGATSYYGLSGYNSAYRLYGEELVWQNDDFSFPPSLPNSIVYTDFHLQPFFSGQPNRRYSFPDVFETIIVYEASQYGEPDSTEIMMSFRCQPELSFDYNDDCRVDFQDFAIWAAEWLECNRQPPVLCDH